MPEQSKPLWAREPRTAGHPPPGTKQERTPPGAGARRYNEMGGVGKADTLDRQLGRA